MGRLWIFLKDGYTEPQDEGYLDCDGYLYVVGRSDRIIISGGREN